MKNRKMNKIISVIAIAAMAVSMVAGCGSSSSSTASTDTKAETEAAAEETEAAADTEAAAETETAAEETASSDEAATPRNETVYFAGQQWGAVNNYNPMSSNSNCWAMSQAGNAREMMYETLFMYNCLDGSVTGLLGDTYTWNDDKTVMTVTLKQDAHFSDGTPFTSADVVATWDAHIKYSSPTGASYSLYIDSMEAVDDYTVNINAKLDDQGRAVNPLQVETYITAIFQMSDEYIAAVDERNGGDATAVCEDKMEDAAHTGPYSPYYASEQKLIFVRDDNYWGQSDSMWGKLPVPKYLAHVIYKDNAAGQTALQQGEVDACQQFITDVQSLWLEDGLPISTWLDEAPYGLCLSMPTIWFNTERNGLDQKEVRKAIAMATDFSQIAASAMSGQTYTFDEMPRCVANPTDAERKYIDFSQLTDLQFSGNDVDGANALLDEAGIVDSDGDGIREVNGENLVYQAECPSGWSDWNATLEIIASAGQNIGIDITTYFPEAASFYDDLTTCNFDIAMWTPTGAEIAGLWARSAAYFSEDYAALEVNWSGNFGHYMNDEADALVKSIPYMTTDEELKEAYTKLSQIYLEEVPSFSAMYRPQAFFAASEAVWTNYPAQSNPETSNIPPLVLTDGAGIEALYHLALVE